MAISRGYTFGATELVTNAKLHALVDDASVTGVTTNDTDVVFTDVTTGNASSTKHGFLPKLANTSTKYLRDDGTWQTVSSGVSYTSGTFVNGDLSTGILTITHNKGLSSPYIFHAEFFDNNGDEVYPDSGTPATNSKTYSFSNFGTLSGTWTYRYL